MKKKKTGFSTNRKTKFEFLKCIFMGNFDRKSIVLRPLYAKKLLMKAIERKMKLF